MQKIKCYYNGKKYGMALNSEIVYNIQMSLEKRVTMYISRHSKEIAPVQASLYVLKDNAQEIFTDSSIADDEYRQIIDMRVALQNHTLAANRKKEIDDLVKRYKSYMAKLEAFVHKVERISDLQYHGFLLGVAKRHGLPKPSGTNSFKSYAFTEYEEKLKKEMEKYE